MTFESIPRDAKLLWVSSSGGHLSETLSLDQLVGSNADSKWITAATADARSMLHGRRANFVPYVRPRDFRGSVRASSVVMNAAKEGFDAIVSTGAALAAVGLLRASKAGHRVVYVESLARLQGPSTTGRLMSLDRNIVRLSQTHFGNKEGWQHEGSLLDNWSVSINRRKSSPGLKIFVSLGTIQPYRFDRCVDAVKAILTSGDSVVWQLGATVRNDLPGHKASLLSHSEMMDHMAWADVVISHGGVGTMLMALETGKVPVLASREARFKEHVDDHQSEVVELMRSAGLGARLEMVNPNRDVLEWASVRQSARR